MVKLPKGVKVCIGAKIYRGVIPDNLCPPKYRDTVKDEKVTDGKHKGTGGK